MKTEGASPYYVLSSEFCNPASTGVFNENHVFERSVAARDQRATSDKYDPVL
jgi:hypothetical protein